ncbi:asparagine synthetase [glutamine-hydrolyzing]-like isoform X1 [Argopecten irradians]|uniref:asparagine synthetase [glutamine-hydrolyzing]-like isoform X1 n=1 Tax=Argopecten irradians TaxID=31199 RepID=UPI00371A8AF8
MQPMRVLHYPNVWLMYNGEIYNYRQLQKQFDFHYTTQCDGEAIIHLYNRGGIEFAARHLDGVFAFCLFDTEKRKVYLGRDTFGVKPLYHVIKEDGSLSVCSEVKGLMDTVGDQLIYRIQRVLPGHVQIYSLDIQYRASLECCESFHYVGANPVYNITTTIGEDVKTNIRTLLRSAVDKRLMSERRIGCLLSGGVDSSLVTSLVVDLAKERKLPYRIQTFSIGMEGSPDLASARKVANHLGTEHHEVIVTPQEAIDVIDDVIYHLETYDIITIRGSIGMYLLCEYVKEHTDTTVILSGEGADEVAQGYIYFKEAPSAEDSDKESRRLCKDISMFYVQRVDRMSSAFGLEIRVPFLDHTFTNYYLSLDPALRAPKKGIEKYLLRSAFEDMDIIPREVLWRQKEGFSDGLTSPTKSWYQMIQDFVEEEINDLAVQDYFINPPLTKESLYYRRIFEGFFSGQGHLIPYFWMPKWSKSSDPSARTLDSYKH